ncbi:MAG: DMT family transporter [Ferrovibrio sp.]|jgi:drug/metabolite transporter (DMT)-like permease|uniref:DMT family transporter n=1 Tax=Ferrovibrio sp. TaxID=1917215 RepID=UPI00391B11A3
MANRDMSLPNFTWMPNLSTAATGILLGLMAAAIWGSYLALSRAGITAGLHAWDIAFIRYGVAGLVMLPWLLRHGLLSLGGVGIVRAIPLTLLVGPPFILIGVGGYAFAPLAHGAVMQPAALTIGGMALAMLVLRDKPTPARIGGVVVILCGLVVIAGPGLLDAGADTPLGDAMFIAAGLMWAGFTVLQRRWGLNPIQATAAVSALAALAYVPAYLVFVGIDRLSALPLPMLAAQILVQGVLSGVVAVIAFSRAVQLLGASRASAFPALVPAVAILIGIPVTGELPTFLQIGGLVLVTLGLLLAVGLLKLRSPLKA